MHSAFTSFARANATTMLRSCTQPDVHQAAFLLDQDRCAPASQHDCLLQCRKAPQLQAIARSSTSLTGPDSAMHRPWHGRAPSPHQPRISPHATTIHQAALLPSHHRQMRSSQPACRLPLMPRCSAAAGNRKIIIIIIEPLLRHAPSLARESPITAPASYIATSGHSSVQERQP